MNAELELKPNRQDVADDLLVNLEGILADTADLSPGDLERLLDETWKIAGEVDLVEHPFYGPEDRVSVGRPDLEDLAALRSILLEKRRALAYALDAVEGRIAGMIGEDGKVRLGDDFLEAKRPRRFRIEDGAEPEFWRSVYLKAAGGVTDLEETIDGLRETFNLNTVRKGGLRTLAEMIEPEPVVDEETGEIVGERTILDLWKTEVDEDAPPRLEVRPLSKAPKFVADLPEGEIRKGRGKGEPA